MFTYKLRELHFIGKLLGSQDNTYIADKTDQPNRGAYAVSVDCIHVIGLSIKTRFTLKQTFPDS